MTTYFVSRHDGALRWARILQKQGGLPLDIDVYVSHLDAAQLRKGDVVIGTLPVREIQRLRETGVRFLNLDLQVPPELRGQELTATQMAACGATLTEYRVSVKDSHPIDAMRRLGGKKTAQPKPAVTLVLVSQELLPQYLGFLHQPTPQVILLVTPAMKERVKHLKTLLNKAPQPPAHLIELPLRDAGGYADLREQAEAVFDELLLQRPARIVLNLTGGTKLMSLAFAGAARTAQREHDALDILYVDTAQGRIDSLGESPSQPMQAMLGVADAVLASGKADAGCASASDLFKRQMLRHALHAALLDKPDHIGLLNLLCAERLDAIKANKKNARPFQLLAEEHRTTQGQAMLQNGSLQLRPGCALIKPLQGRLGHLLHQQDVLESAPERRDDGSIALHLARPSEWSYLQGGWLEAEAARRIQAAAPDDWACGVAMGKITGRNNENDAMVTAGNRTLLIEIKTANLGREQVQDDGSSSSKGADTLYKLDSIGHELARYFGANWLISARPLSQPDLERAKDKRITVFCPEGQETVAGALERFDAALAEWIASSRQYAPGGIGLPMRPLGISSDWVKRERQDSQPVTDSQAKPTSTQASEHKRTPPQRRRSPQHGQPGKKPRRGEGKGSSVKPGDAVRLEAMEAAMEPKKSARS